MDKGWALTLDADRSVGLFLNKPSVGLSLLTPRFKSSGVMFPMNLNSSGEDEDRSSHLHLPAVDVGTRGVAVGEVDFFSDDKRSSTPENKSVSIIVKKENTTDCDVNTGLNLLTAISGSDQSTLDDGVSSEVEDRRAKEELTLLQSELQRMNSENQRLRGMLTQVTNNYSALQIHLMNLMQQQQKQQLSPNPQINHDRENLDGRSKEKKRQDGDDDDEWGNSKKPRQFMELGPSNGSVERLDRDDLTHSSSEERTVSGSLPGRGNANIGHDNKRVGREESPESEAWAPNKLPKLTASKSSTTTTTSSVDPPAESTMRKARVSVRARSEAPMISDGCQWRKYGQKMAKGHPCPRAYYRCTMAVGCPVRKQVQRCAEDRTILITTYEGTHNHPLPPAAMAMASTTSAAANMLLSGSMSSADGLLNQNFLARGILPCSSSMATISASAPFPTVTLDLTHSQNPFQRPAPPQFQPPNLTSPPTPLVFGQPLYNQSKFSGLHVSPGMDPTQLLTHDQAAPSAQLQHQVHIPFAADTVSAAAAAITVDPNFTAALAAAISSIIGGAQPCNINGSTNNHTSTSNSNKSSSFPGH